MAEQMSVESVEKALKFAESCYSGNDVGLILAAEVRRLQAENAALREIALMAESLRARLCIVGLHEKPEINLEHEQLTTALQDAYESGAFPEWIRK